MLNIVNDAPDKNIWAARSCLLHATPLPVGCLALLPLCLAAHHNKNDDNNNDNNNYKHVYDNDNMIIVIVMQPMTSKKAWGQGGKEAAGQASARGNQGSPGRE